MVDNTHSHQSICKVFGGDFIVFVDKTTDSISLPTVIPLQYTVVEMLAISSWPSLIIINIMEIG